MLTLRQLEVFNAVMEAGSVVGAAKILNVTQPVVSRVLRHLEDQTKVKLFERAKGRLQPTHQARSVFNEVSHIFRNIRGLEAAFEKMSVGEDMTFRIGSSPSVAAHVVPKAIIKLRAKYPKLIIKLDVLSVSQISDYLVYGEGELVVGVFPQTHPSITNQRLGTGEIVGVMPSGSRGASESRMEEAELRSMLSGQLIGFEVTTPHGQLISAFLSGEGMAYKPNTVVRFAETACQMVRVGLGSALVDGFTAAGFRSREITVRRLERPPTMGVFAHTRIERGMSAFGRVLCHAISSELEQGARWFDTAAQM